MKTEEFRPTANELPDLFELEGELVRLEYVGSAHDREGYGEGLSEMMAESPGLYMPSFYSLTEVATGKTHEFLVFGEGGFNPYEMASHLAVSREGATPVAAPVSMNESLVCDHGLSAALCAGPDHYPSEGWL
jgi:hypothetical protein